MRKMVIFLSLKNTKDYENSEVRSIPLGKLGEKQGTLGICRWRVAGNMQVLENT